MGLLEDLAKTFLESNDDDDDEPMRKTAKKSTKKLDVGGIAQFIQVAVALISQIGLPKLIDMFKKAGLGKQIASWIGAGKNQKVSGEEVESALGAKFMGSLAKKTGMDKDDASEALAKYLPKVVDFMTPDGEADDAKAKKKSEGFDLGDVGDLLGSILG